MRHLYDSTCSLMLKEHSVKYVGDLRFVMVSKIDEPLLIYVQLFVRGVLSEYLIKQLAHMMKINSEYSVWKQMNK